MVALIVGAFPVFLEWNATTGSHVAEWKVSGELIASNFTDLSRRHLRRLALGTGDYHLAYTTLRITVWGLAFMVAGVSVYRGRRYWPVLAPLAFLLIFLVLYLPHPMAAEGATRYLIPFWTILTILLLAVPVMNLSFARWVLAAWLVLNLVETLVAWDGGFPRKKQALEERQEVVQKAHAIGAETVNMVGGYIFGHHGQTYSWSATNQICFVSSFDERRQEKAQLAELTQPQVLACARGHFNRLRQTLNTIGVTSTPTLSSPVSFFSDLRVTAPEYMHTPFVAQSLRGEEIVTLNDRVYPTEHQGQAGEGFVLDLTEAITPSRIWLLGKGPYQETLPNSLAIYAATDQADWTLIYESADRFKVAYSIENQVYAKGFFGLMECVPHAHTATKLKFVCRKAGAKGGTWGISEVFVHASAGPMQPTHADEIEEIKSWMKSEHIEFLVADRWLSARFFGNGVFDVYPRYNSKFLETQASRILYPRPTLALAVRSGMIAETERMFHPSEIREIRRTKHYGVFLFTTMQAKEQRIWNGHAVLRNTGPEPPWF